MCGTWPPSAKLDFQRNRIWTILYLTGAHCLQLYIPTKCPENTLIGGRDMPVKRNSKLALWRWNSASDSIFHKCHVLREPKFLRIIVQDFQKIAQRTAELLRFSFSLHTFQRTLLTTQCRHTGHLFSNCVLSPEGMRCKLQQTTEASGFSSSALIIALLYCAVTYEFICWSTVKCIDISGGITGRSVFVVSDRPTSCITLNVVKSPPRRDSEVIHRL